MKEVLNYGESRGAEFLDIRKYKVSTLTLISNETKDTITNYGDSIGSNIRVLYRGNWGYKVVSRLEINREDIDNAINSAYGNEKVNIVFLYPKREYVYIKEKIPISKSPLEIMNDIKKIKNDIVKLEPRIKSVNVRYYHVKINKEYYSTEDREIIQTYSISGLSASVVAREGDIVASAYNSVATYLGYVIELFDINQFIETLVNRVRKQLKGVIPKAGYYPVILSPDVAGVFAHEAIGHLAEADLAVNGIVGKIIGRKVADEKVTISDSPTVDHPEAIGITKYDDEGVEGKEVNLIENGVVKGLLTDRFYSAYLGLTPTGNARAEDFRSSVIIRMRNTYFKPGDWKLEELFEDIKEGYYMVSVMGGQTNLDGTFQFGIQEGFRIVNGEIKEPLRNVSIAGYTIETLGQISRLSRDLEFHPGYCGKSGQSVPVSTGGPYIRVERIKVGGIT
jgi:TldD protein